MLKATHQVQIDFQETVLPWLRSSTKDRPNQLASDFNGVHLSAVAYTKHDPMAHSSRLGVKAFTGYGVTMARDGQEVNLVLKFAGHGLEVERIGFNNQVEGAALVRAFGQGAVSASSKEAIKLALA